MIKKTKLAVLMLSDKMQIDWPLDHRESINFIQIDFIRFSSLSLSLSVYVSLCRRLVA